MMKKIYCIIVILQLVFTHISYGQKHDNNWIFGSANVTLNGGGSILSFDDNEILSDTANIPINMDATNASISDEDGNLLFYTNGIHVVNRNHEIMENGDSLNLDGNLDSFSQGLRSPQAALILPFPEHENKFLIFHNDLNYIQSPNNLDVGALNFYVTEVDLSFNQGDGKVISKNQILLSDTINAGKIVSTKHGNGRDWWVVVQEYNENILHKWLLTNTGITYYGISEVDDTIINGLGQAGFSPNGNCYATLSLINDEDFFTIFSFDRCEGEFNQIATQTLTDMNSSGGMSFSPNSKFLYVVTTTLIRQYDLEASNIIDSEIIVANYDNYFEPLLTTLGDTISLPTTFFMAQLGADGKIYINCPNGVRSLHVINSPDLLGEDCDVTQHSFQLPRFNIFSLPNFPNYQLGNFVDSPCDTLDFTDSTEEIVQQKKIKIYPNPTDGEVTLQYPQVLKEDRKWVLYNSLGQIVTQRKLESGQKLHHFNLAFIPKGMYVYSVFQNGRLLNSGKLVIK